MKRSLNDKLLRRKVKERSASDTYLSVLVFRGRELSAGRRSFAEPVLGRCKRQSEPNSRGPVFSLLAVHAGTHTGKVVLAFGFSDAQGPYERIAGSIATYTVSVPDRRARADPGLGLLSENPHFSGLGNPLLSSTGTRTLRRGPSWHL